MTGVFRGGSFGQTDQVDPGRRAHYGAFYDPGDGPAALVYGNCQAEALRVLLAPSLPDLDVVRLPPVHELTAADLPSLSRLLDRAVLLVAQPVRAGYRDLPLGTAEVAGRTRAQLVVVPAVQICSLHPFQALVRDPADQSLSPPLVDYHDLRTLAAAAGHPRRPVDPRALIDVGRTGVQELARREQGTDVGVSDVVDELGSQAAWTINHPGNAVLRVLASRVLHHLGRPADVADPGRVLLGAVRAPLEAQVLDALGLPDPPREHWLVDGEALDDAEVRRAHTAWYAARPALVTEGLRRHAEAMQRLGLGP